MSAARAVSIGGRPGVAIERMEATHDVEPSVVASSERESGQKRGLRILRPRQMPRDMLDKWPEACFKTWGPAKVEPPRHDNVPDPLEGPKMIGKVVTQLADGLPRLLTRTSAPA